MLITWPRPRARMPGSTARVSANRPKQLTSNCARIAASSPSSTVLW